MLLARCLGSFTSRSGMTEQTVLSTQPRLPKAFLTLAQRAGRGLDACHLDPPREKGRHVLQEGFRVVCGRYEGRTLTILKGGKRSFWTNQVLTIRGKDCDRCPPSYLAERICGLTLLFDVASSSPFIKSMPWADLQYLPLLHCPSLRRQMARTPEGCVMSWEPLGGGGGVGVQEVPCPLLPGPWHIAQYPAWESHYCGQNVPSQSLRLSEPPRNSNQPRGRITSQTFKCFQMESA